MKKNLLIGQVLQLMMMSCVSSTSASLSCYSDYIDIITCKWDRTSAEERFHIAQTTNCSLHAKFNDDKLQICQSDFVPVGNPQLKLYKATLNFLNETISNGFPTLPLKVLCGNMTEAVQEVPHYNPSMNIKLYPPNKPLVENGNVTWERGSPFPRHISMYLFEVQWRQIEDNWETKKRLHVQETRCELPIETLSSGGTYEVRVRSTTFSNQKFWSEWSPVTRFSVNSPHVYLDPNDLLFGITSMTSIAVFIAAVIILMVFLCICHYKSSLKDIFVPKPSMYFDKMFSPNEESKIKSWLVPGLLLKPELEPISPVKVFKAFDSDKSFRKSEKFGTPSDNSSFSNSIYFLSKNSKCPVTDQLEPCSLDSPYGPADGNNKQEKIDVVSLDSEEDLESAVNSPLETSSFDKQLPKLRLDVQSPDSGFAGSSIDHESQDESGSEGLPSPPVVDSTRPISHILPYPLPQLGGFHHQLIQPKFGWNSWNNQTFPQLTHSVFSNLMIPNSDVVACSGMVEPCSDDYLSVKKIQD